MSAAPAMASRARMASQAARTITTNNSITNHITVVTRPGQTVDAREVAKEINRLQTRSARSKGLE